MNQKIVFLGTIVLKAPKDLIDTYRRTKKRIEIGTILELHNNFFDSLDKNVNVRDLEKLDIDKSKPLLSFDNFYEKDSYYLPNFPYIIKFNTSLSFFNDKGEKKLIDISLLYNGIVFLAFSNFSEENFSDTSPARSIRKYLLDIFSNDDIKAQIIAPCPLRFTIFNELKYNTEKIDNTLEYMISIYKSHRHYINRYSTMMTIETSLRFLSDNISK